MMDSDFEEEIQVPNNRKKGFLFVVFQLALLLVFPFFAFFLLSLLVGFIAILNLNLSITAPVSVLSQCRIVSSGVDLRSSKVCELGLLNYKAKHVFYPFDRTKFRCRYDYYWASVFEVEYNDHSLAQKRVALVEAPNEALPLSCRPNFGAAWLTKDKFKVNETYDCWYTYGISEVRLDRNGFFSCQAKDPSTMEMIRRYFFLFMKISKSWFAQKGKNIYWRWEMIVGVVSGMFTALVTIFVMGVLHHMKTQLPQTYVARMVSRSISTVFFKRACFLVAYFSVVGWLAIQYGKKLGLP